MLLWNEISKLSFLMFVSTINFFDILKVVSRAIWGQQHHIKVWNYSHYGHREQPDTYNSTDVSVGCFDLCAVGLGQSRSANIEHLKSLQAQWTWSLCFLCTMLRSLQHSYSKRVSCSWCLCLLRLSLRCCVWHSAKAVQLLSDCFVTEMCFLGSKKGMLYSFFWMIPQAYEFYVPTFRDTVSSEMSAHKIHEPGNHPKNRIQHSEHSGNLKSRKDIITIYTL
jgi:hypothetical protein